MHHSTLFGRSAARVKLTGLFRSNAVLLAAAGVGVAMASLPASAQQQHVLAKDGQHRVHQVWAKQGMTKNPVAFCIDPWGNLYIAESDRAGNAVQDTRNIAHLNPVEEDLRFRSVEDRLAQIRKWTGSGAFPPDYFTKTEDRVRVVADTDGDGVADVSKVYAGGFNHELDGIGSGVLWHNGSIFFTCIPNLWSLTDSDGDLQADKRESLSYGYGVRWCFYGHDLHGLTMGPDGRVYFSMGDRGYNVTTKEGSRIVGVDRGGVFRCWPDGTGLELIYQGLRNPQDLAFNDLGDLFTGDNNCDSGDRARVVAIYEGGDSGWRQDVQSLDSRGPWNRESIWRTLKDASGPGRPAWTLPPIEYMGAGPSGIEFYPGVGESHAYDSCFFMVDFYGSGGKVRAFRCVPQGAAFKLTDVSEYYAGSTITDIKWGYDGRLYMTDWGGGWSPNENGNIVTITNKTVHDDASEAAAIKEIRGLFEKGFDKQPEESLLAMLGHRDQRVRQAAQFELAARATPPVGMLTKLAADKDAAVVTRAHAIWALGQIARKNKQATAELVPLLSDGADEIRVQAVRTIGDLKPDASLGVAATCVGLLKDPAPRVRHAAATALARIGDASSTGPLLELLAANDNKDLVIRHAASYALSRVGNADELVNRSLEMNAAARLGAVLALRLMDDARSGGVAAFLNDADAAVAVEAARAVYDLRIESGMPILAALVGSVVPSDRAIDAYLRRAIEANVLLGTDQCAERLAAFAARVDVGAEWRLLALQRLDGWDKPLKREGVWGNWVDLPGRPVAAVQRAVRGHIGDILRGAGSDQELTALAKSLRTRHALELTPDQMEAFVADSSQADMDRIAVLDQIATTSPDRIEHAAVAILDKQAKAHGELRRRAGELLVKANPEKAAEVLSRDARESDAFDRQTSIALLASMNTAAAHETIAALVDDMRVGALDRAVSLDVFQAALALPPDSPDRRFAEKHAAQGRRPAGFTTDMLSAGGDAAAGRDIFLHHASAQCVRCHAVNGFGGNAGPDLTRVASRLKTPKLVESLVEPAAEISPGYGTVSAMPVMSNVLSPREVRNVVSYLQTLGAPASVMAVDDHSEGGSSGVRLLAVVLMGVVGVGILRSLKHADDSPPPLG